MKHEESAQEIYSSMSSVWPEKSPWYDYTHKTIINFIHSNLNQRLQGTDKYINAGSGGSTYHLPGVCYHVDIAENLIQSFPHHAVASIESLPYPNSYFDAAICVGSVINYCDLAKSIRELSRTLKPGGYLVLEFERSNTGELWGMRDFGTGATKQKYKYLGHLHTLWLYSEKLVVRLLKENELMVIKNKRYHCLSALINRVTEQEDISGRFGQFDPIMAPVSYITAHNVIMLCRKKL